MRDLFTISANDHFVAVNNYLPGGREVRLLRAVEVNYTLCFENFTRRAEMRKETNIPYMV